MPRIMILLLLFIAAKSMAQRSDDPRSWIRQADKVAADSIANIIDHFRDFRVVDSATVLDEYNPEKINGYFITRLYKKPGSALARVTVTAPDQPERSFYYQDSILLKAEIGPPYKKTVYYYPKEVSRSYAFVWQRLAKLYPETKDYWSEFEFGILYIKELRVH